MAYRVVDLCAGAAGGWSLGLHRAGMQTVAACESVAWRRAMYAHNNPGVVAYDDLRTLTGARLLADLGYLPDVVAGSPPCKEYSSIGRGGGLDADDLFSHAVRLTDEVRPRWFLAENSDRIKTRGYDRIAASLEAIGYTCWPLVVGAGNAGAAHRRPRTFVLATDLSSTQGRLAGQSRPSRRVGRMVAGDAGPGAGHARQNLPRLGPAGTERLGGHLRIYDRVPAWLAERCREAYGDAVLPQLTELVGRAVLDVDAAMLEAA